jgi:hypothetical protein
MVSINGSMSVLNANRTWCNHNKDTRMEFGGTGGLSDPIDASIHTIL